jgi:23S rRNA (guanosine2251-2'-O)-methyltransferase
VTPARRAALEAIVLHATRLRIPIVEVEGGSLTALAGFDGHQGVALVVGPRAYATVDEILARAVAASEPALILVMDSLEDPQNVGTLLRSAEAAGAHGVVFPTHRQAPLTPAAVKASAGAVEHLALAPVDDLAGALTDLHVRGVRIVGADSDAPLAARQADLRGPIALVVGSEGRGLAPAVRRRCDLVVRIPMRGRVGSLNAAVAGSVLLYEALCQRHPDGRSAPVALAPRRAETRPDGPPDAIGATPADLDDPVATAAETKPAREAADAEVAASADATTPTADDPTKAATVATAAGDGSAPAPRRRSTRRRTTEAPADEDEADPTATAPASAVEPPDGADPLLPG